MTTFRAIGISASHVGDGADVSATGPKRATRDGDVVVAEPTPFVAIVSFVEVLDGDKTRELSRQEFTVTSAEDLQRECLVVLEQLKKQQADARLAIAVSGQTIAEVSVL